MIWLIVAVWIAMGAGAWLWAVWKENELTLGEVLIIVPMALLGPITLAIVASYLIDFRDIFGKVVWGANDLDNCCNCYGVGCERRVRVGLGNVG